MSDHVAVCTCMSFQAITFEEAKVAHLFLHLPVAVAILQSCNFTPEGHKESLNLSLPGESSASGLPGTKRTGMKTAKKFTCHT